MYITCHLYLNLQRRYAWATAYRCLVNELVAALVLLQHLPLPVSPGTLLHG